MNEHEEDEIDDCVGWSFGFGRTGKCPCLGPVGGRNAMVGMGRWFPLVELGALGRGRLQ
ncbi:hypothetical protein [Acidithiobacillus sp.]|uniref:hypothetical protein n=1 Tax=Acidithiobacillus sp. TaxID=1872118 RepID=UPI0032B01B5E